MKKFTGKYETLIEAAITRFEQGGLLSGDIVKFRKDVMKNEKVKAMMDNYKAMIEDAINTDLNLRVSAIKSIRPTTSGNYEGGHNSGTDSPTDHYVDIVVEYAPGLWRNPITVPMEVLERVDTGINMAPIPDSLKKKYAVTGPNAVNSPDADRKTPTTNTKPEFTASINDGRNQAKKPVEKKKKNQGKLTLEDITDEYLRGDDGRGNLKTFKITFGNPLMDEQPDEIISRIQTMPGLSNNMEVKPIDANTLNISMDSETTAQELENMITNIIDGRVSVEEVETEDDYMTKFDNNPEPEGVVVAGQSPSVGI